MKNMGRYLQCYYSTSTKNLALHQLLFLTILILQIGILPQAMAKPAIAKPASSQFTLPTLRICYEDKNNFPFTTAENTSDTNTLGLRGTLADIVITASQAIELPIEFVRLPWKRCIQHLSQGKTDAIFAAIWTPEREKWGVFPKINNGINSDQRLWRARYPIFTAKHTRLQWHDGYFTGLNLGVSAPLGYVAHDKLDKLGVLPVNNLAPEEGFRLISKERLDGYVIERFIGKHIIQQLKLSKEISSLPTDFMQRDWFMPVSQQWYQQHPQLTHQLWQSLSEVRKEQGEVIFNRYIEE